MVVHDPAGLVGALTRTGRALRLGEDAWRLARLLRWIVARDRLTVPHGSPRPPSSSLAHLLAGDDRRLDVGLGATLIAWEDDPSTDVERVLDTVERMAISLRSRLRSGPSDPPSRLAILNSYVFDELGFMPAVSSRSRYSEDRLADLLFPQVLLRRRGHCVGLSAVYLALGYRAGLPLFGVSVPGHFFVRWDGDGFRQNIELTARGAAHPDSYYSQRFRIGQHQIDRGIYLQSLRRREVLVEILNNRANFYWDRGDEARVVRDLDRVVQASHNFARAYAGRGFIALQRGDLTAAQRDLERALEIDPDYGRAGLLLGQVHLRQGWLSRAGDAFERATERDSDNAVAATYLGRYYSIRGEHDRAIRWHDQAIKRDPRCATAWVNMGRARAALGDLDAARTAFREARRLAPENLSARENLALLDQRHGRRLGHRLVVRRICRDYERQIALSPANDHLRSRYVRFLLGAGKHLQRALELARDVVSRTDTSHDLETLAHVLLRLGRREEALVQFERACRADESRGGLESARLEAVLEDARRADDPRDAEE